MRIDGGAHQRSEREVGPLRPKSQKIAAQRQILARQLSGMSGIFLRTGRDLQRLHWLAVCAVLCEPVSASLPPLLVPVFYIFSATKIYAHGR